MPGQMWHLQHHSLLETFIYASSAALYGWTARKVWYFFLYSFLKVRVTNIETFYKKIHINIFFLSVLNIIRCIQIFWLGRGRFIEQWLFSLYKNIAQSSPLIPLCLLSLNFMLMIIEISHRQIPLWGTLIINPVCLCWMVLHGLDVWWVRQRRPQWKLLL